MSNCIRDAFDAYLGRVGLADAGPLQRRELRRAFYAGAWEVLCAVHEVGGESMSKADVIARLEATVAECEEFADRVVGGRDWE
jgi:hypothetical protein